MACGPSLFSTQPIPENSTAAKRKCGIPSASPKWATWRAASCWMAPSRAIRKCGCCATTWWSTPGRSVRCGASKTTSARSRAAWSAALRWTTTGMSSRATSSKPSRRSASPTKPPEDMPAIGVVTLELRLENAHSLKEKRHVVESLKDRLRHKFNVAVAEIEYQELWQRSAIAAVTVSSDRVHAEKVLRGVEEEAAALLGAALMGATVEWLA